MSERCYECGHRIRVPIRRRWRLWRARRRSAANARRAMRIARQPTDLMEKYEALAADREVWIRRAHGEEPGWPLDRPTDETLP